MFVNLGRTLSLLRELRGKSQASVAREAGIGKSQLSKYENGKELPKLDSLEKVLIALEGRLLRVLLHPPPGGPPGRRPGGPESAEEAAGGGEPLSRSRSTCRRSGTGTTPLLAGNTDQAFSQVFTDLLLLYRRVFEQMVLPPGASGRSSRLRADGFRERARSSPPSGRRPARRRSPRLPGSPRSGTRRQGTRKVVAPASGKGARPTVAPSGTGTIRSPCRSTGSLRRGQAVREIRSGEVEQRGSPPPPPRVRRRSPPAGCPRSRPGSPGRVPLLLAPAAAEEVERVAGDQQGRVGAFRRERGRCRAPRSRSAPAGEGHEVVGAPAPGVPARGGVGLAPAVVVLAGGEQELVPPRMAGRPPARQSDSSSPRAGHGRAG